MAFLTDRKRVLGLGAARTGTDHHWSMTVSSVALLILVPLFIFTFGRVLGQDHASVIAYFGQPFPALIAGLTLLVGFMHFKNGVRILIEDYVQGYAREFWIIVLGLVSYGAAAAGIFAIARIAL